MKKLRACFLVCIMLLCACGAPAKNNGKLETETAVSETVEEKGEIFLATTTSTKDSGLLDEILPVFEETTGYSVSFVSVGSGEAMKMGENGEADVLLVHSPAEEKAFVEAGHADEDGRFDVMYNEFIIVGPTADPVELSIDAPNDAAASFKKLSESAPEGVFISRADESGTLK